MIPQKRIYGLIPVKSELKPQIYIGTKSELFFMSKKSTILLTEAEEIMGVR
jgi:hypothetical protein